MHFVYVKVPLSRRTTPSFDALHLALEQVLDDTGAGSLVSWGTSLASAHATEHDPGSFHRLDIELRELDSGLRLLQDVLLTQQVPHGTELHFTDDDERQQALSGTGWGTKVPSTGTHRPGAKRDAAGSA